MYDDTQYDEVLAQVSDVSPYALTGAIIAQDRAAIAAATESCGSRQSFYSTTSPPARWSASSRSAAAASGTNDKSGSMLNLTRWASPRTIKGCSCRRWTSVPHMG